MKHDQKSVTDQTISPGAANRLRDRVGVLQPLRIRDFSLLWTALSVSLLGDGLYYVAIAWQVYQISNVPTALSAVSFAASLPLVAFTLFGGVVSDRFDRRKVMIAADVVRGLAIGTMGILSVSGILQLWHLIGLAAIYGTGQAFFGPAFGAIVPDIVPTEQLLQANSLGNLARPFAERLIGPALGGFAVAFFGAGPAFLLDAATFTFSAGALSLMSPRPVSSSGALKTSAIREIGDGFRFVRSQTWLWGTLLSVSLTLLFVLGPFQILVPYLIKNKFGGGPRELGLVFAAGGVGAIVAALFMGQRQLPRRHILFMYIGWGLGVFSIVFWAAITKTWHAMVLEGGAWALFTGGLIVWHTLMHRLVPRHILGRVTSLDWMISSALVPLSFAITGPISQAIGIENTFLFSGILGGAAIFGFLLIPGIRDTEKRGNLEAKTLKREGAPREFHLPD